MAILKSPKIRKPKLIDFTLPAVESGRVSRNENTAKYSTKVISNENGHPIEQLSPEQYRFLAEWHGFRLPTAGEHQYLVKADPAIFRGRGGNVTNEFNITDLVKPRNQPVKTVMVKGRDPKDLSKEKIYQNKVSLWEVEEEERQVGEVWFPIDEYTTYVKMHPALGVPDGLVEDLLVERDMTWLLYNPFAINGNHPSRITVAYMCFHEPNKFALYVLHPNDRYQGNGARFMKGPVPYSAETRLQSVVNLDKAEIA